MSLSRWMTKLAPKQAKAQETSQRETACGVCHKLLNGLRTAQRVSLGLVKDVLLESDCEHHKNLIYFCVGLENDLSPDTELFLDKVRGLWDRIAVIDSDSSNLASKGFWLLPESSTSEPSSTGTSSSVTFEGPRIVHPEWIDITQIKHWYKHCHKKHRTICTTSMILLQNRWFKGPMWLIDCSNHCIVPALEKYKYVALSYVWGSCGASNLQARLDNIAELQKHNALRNVAFESQISNTVKHAIALTRALGERYLWVDVLCIVQDDSTKKHQELGSMALIYGKASLTVIARQGHDAQYGLPGLRGTSQQRDFSPRIFKLGRDAQVMERRCHLPDYTSKWASRGWTYQEELFSRRKLIFDHDSVFWHCGNMSCHEESAMMESTFLDPYHLNSTKLFSNSHPDMLALRNTLQQFNCKSFTFPEDVLKAFWGVATTLTTNFKGGFVGGLPAIFFDIALLWQPESHMSRRIANDPSAQKMWLPSWSWAGWSGRINPCTWDQGSDYNKDSRWRARCDTTERVVPIVQWFAQELPDSPPVLLSQDWHQLRNAYLHTDRAPPNGWEKCTIGPSDNSSRGLPLLPPYPPEGKDHPKHYFKRTDYVLRKEDPFPPEYWYPIPISDANDDRRPLTAVSILSCRTRRTTLYGAEPISSDRPVVSVRDGNGSWVGALQLMSKMPQPSEPLETSTGFPMELVALSEGYIYEFQNRCIHEEWTLDERPTSGERYEFYNVMYVEWEDGYASRKGLGRVYKSAWERQDLEWVDLKLC